MKSWFHLKIYNLKNGIKDFINTIKLYIIKSLDNNIGVGLKKIRIIKEIRRQ